MVRMRFLRTGMVDTRRTLALASALLLATLAGGCAAPAAASAARVPESVLSFLDAAQSKDLAALLDTIAPDEVADGRDTTQVMYDVWFASASDLSWHIATATPGLDGALTTLVDVDARYGGVEDPFWLVITTNREGRIVSWYADKGLATESS